MKKKPMVVIIVMYAVVCGFELFSTQIFDRRMHDDLSKIEERMRKDGVHESTSQAIRKTMSETANNVYHYVSQVSFLIINFVVLVAIMAMSRINELEKALDAARTRAA